MKKILLPLMAVAALLTACDEEQLDYTQPRNEGGITFTVPDFINESGTRVDVSVDDSGAHFTWTEGDTLGVFPQNGYQTAFPISGGAGTNTALFDGGDWALRPNASYAAYYPFNSMNTDSKNVRSRYDGQKQIGNNSTAHLGKYDFMASSFQKVSENGNINFTMTHLGALLKFKLTMPEPDTYSKLIISTYPCKTNDIPDEQSVNLETLITINKTIRRTEFYDDVFTLYLEDIATDEVNQTIELYSMMAPVGNWRSSRAKLKLSVVGSKCTYTALVDHNTLEAGNIYQFSTSCEAQPLEYVDLGLPSGTLWSTKNLGAVLPGELGGFFQWGETISQNANFDFAHYKWWDNSQARIRKYCCIDPQGRNYVDNLSVLELEDDAATSNWGEEWRIPSVEQFEELCKYCTFDSERNLHNYRYNALVLTSNINGNTIIIPNAMLIGTGPQSFTVAAGEIFWTNSVDTNNPYEAFSYTFFGNRRCFAAVPRYYGLQIRPVYVAKNHITSISVTGSKNTIYVGENITLMATLTPADAPNKTLRWSSDDESVATVSTDGLVTAVAVGSATISATATDGSGVKGEYQIRVVSNVHDYVDLGLTSNGKPIYWATCNVGATQPEEYGDYFAWGETEPYYTEGHAQDNPCENWKSGKCGYNWANYKYCNGSDDTQIKYCTSSDYGIVDNKTVLEASDDAASVNWGGSWRMPTHAEQYELVYSCTWTWTTLNGVNGYNVVGPNGNSIFLPAAGYRLGDNLARASSWGNFWSSSLYVTEPWSWSAFGLHFEPNYRYFGNDFRYWGFSIRPVCQ